MQAGIDDGSVLEVDTGNDNLVTLFRDTVARCGDQVALRHEDAGHARELTWTEYAEQAGGFAAGLRERGIGHGEHVVLMMRNTPDFYVADVGCLLAGAVPVSVYDSPSVERLADVLHNCEARAIVVDDAAFLLRARRALPEPEAALLVGVQPETHEVDVAPFADLCGTDPVDLDAVAASVSREDTAVMLYTSGTSGAPKGVPLSHRNLIHSIDSFTRRGRVDLRGREQLSYLPMAHIGERFATHYLHMAQGSTVNCCTSVPQVPGTLARVHPHMFFGAPRMWENLHAQLRAYLAAHPEERAAFEAELDARRGERESGVPTARIGDGAISRVLARFGLDRIEVSIVGSAPLPPHIQTFWIDCGLPLGDFYGQTETGGMGTWDPDHVTIGTVGRPMPGIEVKISDMGEILSRSQTNFDGYYREPERTAESFTEDGFFRTGDLGELDAEGNLRIVGRAGDMIVPTSGHNVVPGPLEGALMRHPLVAYVCVLGTMRPHVTALIVLDAPAALAWLEAEGHGGAGTIRPETHPAVLTALAEHVAETNGQLPGAELIRSHRVVGDEWTMDSDVLTATGKMRRKGVAQRYEEIIEGMYAGESDGHDT